MYNSIYELNSSPKGTKALQKQLYKNYKSFCDYILKYALVLWKKYGSLFLWTVDPVTFTFQSRMTSVIVKQYSTATRNVTVMSALRAAMIIYSLFFKFCGNTLLAAYSCEP